MKKITLLICFFLYLYAELIQIYPSSNKQVNILLKFRKECKENAQKCEALANFYYRKNKKAAVKYYNMACNVGNSMACMDLGSIYWLEKNNKKAIKFFTKACNLGNKEACSILNILNKM